MVRVEEELRTQRELMDERFAALDKRFAGLQWTLVVGFTIVTVLVTVFELLA